MLQYIIKGIEHLIKITSTSCSKTFCNLSRPISIDLPHRKICQWLPHRANPWLWFLSLFLSGSQSPPCRKFWKLILCLSKDSAYWLSRACREEILGNRLCHCHLSPSPSALCPPTPRSHCLPTPSAKTWGSCLWYYRYCFDRTWMRWFLHLEYLFQLFDLLDFVWVELLAVILLFLAQHWAAGRTKFWVSSHRMFVCE